MRTAKGSSSTAAGGASAGAAATTTTTLPSMSSSAIGLSCRRSVQQYIESIVTTIQGNKALIVDDEVKGILSVVFTQSDLLAKGVYLTAMIKQEHNRQVHLKCIIMCRPTRMNINDIRHELSKPSFGEYHIFFTNILSQDLLQQLAESDKYEVVKQVQEFYFDYFSINEDLFSLNLSNSLLLNHPRPRWNRVEDELYQRTIDGVLSVLLSFKKRPVIRYARSSDIAHQFAKDLKQQLEREQVLFDFRQSSQTLLLILDRRDDPVTPLLTQWTYQAMVHELLGMRNNLINLSKAPGVTPDMHQVVLSQSDPFYNDNMYSNYGDLAEAVKSMLGTYQKQFHSNQQISSIEDMQSFVERYPEFKKLATNVTKHVAVVGELSRLIGQHDLLNISALEQDLVCGTIDHSSHFERVKQKVLDQTVAPIDAIRLVILYALRYETYGGNQLSQLKRLLKEKGCRPEEVDSLDAIISYAGATKRGGDIFGDKDLWAKSIKIVTRNIKGVSNVFTQHKPYLSEIIEQIKMNKLKETHFPFLSDSTAARERPRDVIVFILGGATFEEAAKVAEINAQSGDANSIRVLLGGTTIHNSKSFLDEISKFYEESSSTSTTSSFSHGLSLQ